MKQGIGYRRHPMTIVDLNALGLAELFTGFVQGPHLDTLLSIAVEEDLDQRGDLTTMVTVDPREVTGARIRPRQGGVLAGTFVLDLLMRRYAPRLSWWWLLDDGAEIHGDDVVCEISGPLAALLPIERVMLNMLGRLSGIATTTREFVQAVDGFDVVVCDTRKTTPGLRMLEKYATRCGGSHLHRIGLFDAVLVKDNHVGSLEPPQLAQRVLQAARRARAKGDLRFVQAEVDDLKQLAAVLEVAPGEIDMILLDNMSPTTLRKAVACRDARAPGILLEASGGVTLDSIRGIAASGVDRISVGALTHSAVQLDFGLDLQ